MRAIAVIEATRPGLDSVIVWEMDGRLVAFAYLDGKVKMTRVLDVPSLDEGIAEVQRGFQINAGQLHRVTNWQENTITAEPMPINRRRW